MGLVRLSEEELMKIKALEDAEAELKSINHNIRVATSTLQAKKKIVEKTIRNLKKEFNHE